MSRVMFLSDCNNSNDSSNSVYRALREEIAQLKFGSFQRLVFLWLGAKGFWRVQSLGRHFARGRRSVGGADYLAYQPYSPFVRVAIAIRYWQTPIQRRSIDELWGFMLRHQIPTGLIVTNGRFSPRATEAAHAYPGRPIQLISTARLAGSMASLGLGVRELGGKPVLDEAFFQTLEQLRFASMTRTSDDGMSVKSLARNPVIDPAGEAATIPSPPNDFPVWLKILLAALLALFLAWFFGGLR